MKSGLYIRMRNARRRSGFTLIELMVATLLGTIVFAAVGSLTIYTSRSFVALGNYNDLDEASQNALDVLSRDIRMTRQLDSYATDKLVFVDFDGKTNLIFQWTPPAGTAPGILTRTKAGRTTTLLRQCDFLRFGISQRNVSNNFVFYSAVGTPSQAKLVDVSWRCSRQILQKKVNTESVQTAKIVIRN